jgi:hypothetical protein
MSKVGDVVVPKSEIWFSCNNFKLNADLPTAESSTPCAGNCKNLNSVYLQLFLTNFPSYSSYSDGGGFKDYCFL